MGFIVAAVLLLIPIAAAAKAELSEESKIDGVNLMPFIKNENSNEPHETLFWRSGNHQSVLNGKWKYIISKKENDCE